MCLVCMQLTILHVFGMHAADNFACVDMHAADNVACV